MGHSRKMTSTQGHVDAMGQKINPGTQASGNSHQHLETVPRRKTEVSNLPTRHKNAVQAHTEKSTVAKKRTRLNENESANGTRGSMKFLQFWSGDTKELSLFVDLEQKHPVFLQ